MIEPFMSMHTPEGRRSVAYKVDSIDQAESAIIACERFSGGELAEWVVIPSDGYVGVSIGGGIEKPNFTIAEVRKAMGVLG